MSIEQQIKIKFSKWAKIVSLITAPFWLLFLAMGIYGIVTEGISVFSVFSLILLALGFWGLSSFISAFFKPKLALLDANDELIKLIGCKVLTKKFRMTHLHLETGKVASAPTSESFYNEILERYPDALEGFSEENINWWHQYKKEKKKSL